MAAIHETTVDLLAADPYPKGLPELEPLRLALGDLQTWFLALLDRLGHPRSALVSVEVTFQFRSSDDYNSAVQATIAASAGKKYAARVDYI